MTERETERLIARSREPHGEHTRWRSALALAQDHTAGPTDLARHLAGVAAFVENHVRHGERRLLTVLRTLELDADAALAPGPRR